jgi:L-alanine-DL-glutamate epimerase-like enolase superfamily enzyme
MKIERVEAIRVGAPEWQPTGTWGTSPLDALYDQRLGYREQSMALYNGSGEHVSDRVLYVIVRVTTDTGLTGLGGIALGSEAAASFVELRLAPMIIGRSPFDVELLWETMYRATISVGRKGLVLEAISGIDIALSDIMGKALGQPVYNLLGGRTRKRVRAYCSAGYPSNDLNAFGDLIRNQMSRGFTAFKMRFGYGPLDGRAGMRRNVDLVRTARQAVGGDCDLMADAYMGWSLPYAIEMINMLEPYGLTWVEEPLLPDDIAGYARLRSTVRTPISGGEHEFTRGAFGNCWSEAPSTIFSRT